MRVQIKDWKARQIQREIRFKFHDAAIVIVESEKNESTIKFSGILRETEKAYLFSYDDPDLGISVWCPKSLVTNIEEDGNSKDVKKTEEPETSDVFEDAEMLIAEFEEYIIRKMGAYSVTTRVWDKELYKPYVAMAVARKALPGLESAEKIAVRKYECGQIGNAMPLLKKQEPDKWVEDFSFLESIFMVDELDEEEVPLEYSNQQMYLYLSDEMKYSIELVKNGKADDVEIIIDGECAWSVSGNKIEDPSEKSLDDWCEKMYDLHHNEKIYQ